MKPYKMGKASGFTWRKVFLFFAVVAIIVAVAGFFVIRRVYIDNLKPVNISASDDVIYVLEPGTSSVQIADELRAEGLIRSDRAFTQYVRSNELGEQFKVGTYRLRASMSTQEIVDILIEGKVATDLFTIYPGYTINGIKLMFTDAGFSEADVVAALNPANYPGHPALVDKPKNADLSGYIYPDSYEYIEGETTAKTVITQALDEMADILTPDVRKGIARQKISVYDGLILASIVEGEVSGQLGNDDKAKVAQVFLSRLEQGMRLESNATDGLPAEYDTYNIPALPPAPISNFTKSSLQAVAEPASTDYLFFVSGKDCKTRFSRSNAEHEQLINKYGVAQLEDKCR